MSAGAIVGVAVIALTMVLTPGPNMIYLVSRSITQGRRAGVVSLAGVVLGFCCYLLAAAFGLSSVFVAVPELHHAVRLAGAGYLGWLSWQTVKPGGAPVFAVHEAPGDSTRRLFVMGLLTSLLNPKTALLYLSLIPQFVDPEAGDAMFQALLLGGVQIGVSASVNLALVLGAGAVAVFLGRRPSWLRVQRYAMGAVLGGLAVSLAADSARPAAGSS